MMMRERRDSNIHRVRKKGATLFSTITRISWSIFILFVPLETGINNAQFHVIYLHNSFMTSYFETLHLMNVYFITT